jgi:GDP-4-dehydro-6-deoxy-D-mannose reductase
VRYYEVDIRDTQQVRSVLREVKPEQIYHLAGVSAVDVSWTDPRSTYEVNVLGAHNLFEAATDLAAPARILNVSTSQVYAPSSGCLTEECPLRPDNPYAVSKAMAELLVPLYRDRAIGGIITVRPFNHTGIGQVPNFLIPSIAKQFAEIEFGLRPPKLSVGNLRVRRDFMDVRDVVVAYAMLLAHGKPFEVYNVCSGTPVLLSEVVKMFRSISGIDVTIEIDHDKVRSKEIEIICGDARKLEHEIGWRREIPLQKTLEDMLNFWRAQCRNRAASAPFGELRPQNFDC